jgi:hypothetical protein
VFLTFDAAPATAPGVFAMAAAVDVMALPTLSILAPF